MYHIISADRLQINKAFNTSFLKYLVLFQVLLFIWKSTSSKWVLDPLGPGVAQGQNLLTLLILKSTIMVVKVVQASKPPIMPFVI